MERAKKAVKAVMGAIVPSKSSAAPDGAPAVVVPKHRTEWVGGMTVDLRLFALMLGMMVLAFIVGAVFG
jgi:hypothetical protein